MKDYLPSCIAQKMKFSIKDFFSKCDQIRSFLRIWSPLLKKSLMENFIFCAVLVFEFCFIIHQQDNEGLIVLFDMFYSRNNFIGFFG